MAFGLSKISGTNAERTRLHNRRVVLNCIQSREAAGRVEIAKASSLSTQAISNIIAELEAEGLVRTAGRRKMARGQPPVLYTINSDGAASIGFEVRPDALHMAMINFGGEVLLTRRLALKSSDPGPVFAAIGDLAKDAISESGIDPARILGAGLVIPGPFGVEGLSAAGETVLRGWEAINPTRRAEAALKMPVIVEKDAMAAAISESVCGVAQGLGSFCFLYFGAGIGLGVVARNAPLRGAFGNAGEVGHITVHPGGLPCACGNRGCLEQYASRMSLQRHLLRAGILAQDSDTLGQLSAANDPRIQSWIHSASEALSLAVGILENLFDPESIILGGALPDNILDELIARLELPRGSVARRSDRGAPRVMRGASGSLTAALGGAALVIHDAVTPGFDAARSPIFDRSHVNANN